MSLVFGNDEHMRGCYHQMNVNSTGGLGAYLYLPNVGGGGAGPSAPLPLPTDMGPTPAPYLITGISFAQREKYHLVQCFNDKVYTYAFGHDPTASLIDISFLAFLIKPDGTGMSDAPTTFISEYNSNRLLSNQEYATLTMGTATLRGFLVAMDSATSDAEHNLQSFTYHLLGVEVQYA